VKKELIAEFGHTLLEFYERFSGWEQEAVAESQLSLPQMHTLEMLGHMEKPTMKELAQRLGVTTGTLTTMINRLEQTELVERKPNPDDRRSYLLSLTRAGAAEFEKHHQFHIQLSEEISASFSESELTAFDEYLKRVIEQIQPSKHPMRTE
jgi:DNA-binding MarR family transcriptional regulator